MVVLMYCLKNLWFFDIPLYYTNLNSTIICYLLSGYIYIYIYIYIYVYIYISFGISISFSTVFECNSFETLAILSAILLPMNYFMCRGFYCICFRYSGTIKKFLTILLAHVFSKRQKSISFYIYHNFRFNFYNSYII